MKRMVSFFVVMVLCMSLVMVAAADVSFVPSITAKPAPEVVETTAPASGTDKADETEVALVIKDENEDVYSSSKTAKLIVTPVAEVMNDEAESLPEENAEALKEAYEVLSDEKVVLTEVVDGLDEVLAEQKLDVSNLVVKDLFDLRLSEEDFAEDLDIEGNTIEVSFKADIQEGQYVIIAVYKDGKWVLAKKVLVGEDGIITATLDCLGTVAIIVC